MNLMGSKCAYRVYDGLAIVFCEAVQEYLMLEDVYVDFFQMGVVDKLTRDEIISAMTSEYDVSLQEVEADYDAFIGELRKSLSPTMVENKKAGEFLFLPKSRIYDIMSERLIPFSATIEITDECNENCIHCYRGTRQESYWNLQTFRRTIEELREIGTLQLTLTGGEPFMHPDILAMLREVSQNDFVLSVQTNATILSTEILGCLQSCIVSSMSVSLYSIEDDIHDSVTRQNGSCKKTKQNIEKLLNAGLPVEINCPVMSINKNSMRGVKEYCDNLGINCNFVLKIIPSRISNKDTTNLNIYSVGFFLDCMKDKKIRLYNDIIPHIRNTYAKERYCQTGFRSITFNAQGEGLLCNSFAMPCGNVATMSVNEIWYQSITLNEWRNKISIVNEKCKSCPAFAYCEPCPAHSHALTGRTDSVDSTTCAIGQSFFQADQEYIKMEGGGDGEKGI